MINILKRLLGLHIHDWERWAVVKSFVSEGTAEVVIYQKRTCKSCGKTQIRNASH